MLEFLWTIYFVFIEPVLCHLNLVTPGFGDPTYGRAQLPYSATEKRLIYDNPEVTVIRRKVPLPAHALADCRSWDKEKWTFVSYNVWTMEAIEQREGLHSDLVMCHGINDYAGKLVPHAHHFLKRGFRVIAIDLPSFGRSSGLHGFVPSMRINVRAMHAVIMDVRRWDEEAGLIGVAGRERKLFAEGHSMGGFTALYYAALYAPIDPTEDGSPDLAIKKVPSAEEEAELARRAASNGVRPESKSLDPPPYRPCLSGVAVAAPMITISPQSRPGKATEYAAKVLRFLAGRLPFAKAIKGNVSDDPKVESEFQADPMTYKGLLRISTGLAILDGINELSALASKITCPLVIHHGANDRATNPQGSKEFFDRVGTKPSEKTLKIWPGYEHVMMKNVAGMSKADEEKRDAVLFEIGDWLVAQARK
ncbi:uncharacterized protein PFL1_00217 [Pseudozyma flocculosa PF-1]|uniref:Serine aminopeptidase S33 domain-containing protein n=1 Tax=Pseudozyma flocculosa TaxID=84751 RepID=A0A5C3ETR8_9BASI|nr:uncharacterized protein PFL1_00217 [Pseudozyma flocculosa PF-1]EPQ32019.1 hypothetical protein PFL1_00217 [Pseudozyma flocculosa PF-1]SPO35055.1 uncharacterized protein PSFLO_00526 [Pseudozyma flocculosa]